MVSRHIVLLIVFCIPSVTMHAQGYAAPADERVKPISDWKVVLAGRSSGLMRVDTLKAQEGLTVVSSTGVTSGGIPKIASFRFTKVCLGGDPAERENIGAVFDEYVKLLLVRLRPGDVLIFTNIKGVRPDGSPVTFNDITLRLN